MGSENKAKRHLDGVNAEHRVKEKKHSHKRQKMNKKRPASTSSSPRSDFSQSDDSDEEMAVCPAERCQLPEGDEVRRNRRLPIDYFHDANIASILELSWN